MNTTQIQHILCTICLPISSPLPFVHRRVLTADMKLKHRHDRRAHVAVKYRKKQQNEFLLIVNNS